MFVFGRVVNAITSILMFPYRRCLFIASSDFWYESPTNELSSEKGNNRRLDRPYPLFSANHTYRIQGNNMRIIRFAFSVKVDFASSITSALTKTNVNDVQCARLVSKDPRPVT